MEIRMITSNDIQSLIRDLNSWNKIIYTTTTESTLPITSSQRSFKLAMHAQQYFNKTSTTYNNGGITLLLEIDDITLSTLNICQPIKQYTKIVSSKFSARFIIELVNCDEKISLLAIEAK